MYRQHVDYDVSLSHVLDLMADTNASVSLIYSEPNIARLHLHYMFYYVVASAGLVEKIGGPIEMD